MTDDEKRDALKQRNAAICAYYEAGHKASECASKFKMGRQRVLQILQGAGVWKPYVKSTRTAFLGAEVTPETKRRLEAEALEKGTSVSKLVSDKLEVVQP